TGRFPARLLARFVFTAPAATALYTLSLHDALPICLAGGRGPARAAPRRGLPPDPARGLRRLPERDGCRGGRPPRPLPGRGRRTRSEEHTSELQSRFDLVCRLLLEKKNNNPQHHHNR